MGSSELQIRLFGELELHDGHVSVPPLESGRAASLLAYLLIHRDSPQPRERLAFLLWPDTTEPQARTNLRHVLHHLRRGLPDADRYLDVTARTLQWRAGAPYWLDVAVFEELAAQVDAHEDDQRLAALRDAVALYRGDLLDGWYDEWLLGVRERYRQRYLDLLEQLVGCLAERGDQAEAIRNAEQLLWHDPLNEGSYRLLMRLYDARGERARALGVYHACVTTLERELAVAPSGQTQAVYEALLPVEPEIAGNEQIERISGAPLVGRAAERQQLADLWRAAADGRARLVLLTGDPGVGKTRLVDELRQWCAHQGGLVAAARSHAAEGALAYAPVVSWLRSDDLARHRQRVIRSQLAVIARLLPELPVEMPDLSVPEPLPESDERQRLFDALAATILASDEPLLLVADDLHWADRETLRFLHYLLRFRPAARLLVLATARSEELDELHPLNDLIAGMQALERYTEIEVSRLSAQDTAVLAERMAGQPLAAPDASWLYRETEGNPLFIVETLRVGWRGGEREPVQLSPRVQAVIRARLAQLSEPARRLVGIAATVGREFTVDVIAAVNGPEDETLISGLDELWRRRIVREQGADSYDFTHDKIREVAYHRLSPARRRQHHLEIARVLERLHKDDPAPVAGQLAAHYERAGAASLAIDWYERAAEAARAMHASAEVVRLLWRGTDLLRGLPETPERLARELTFLAAMPGPLVALHGYRSSDATVVHDRALTVAGKLGIELSPPLLWSIAVKNVARGDFDIAREYGERMRAHGEREQDEVLIVQSNYVLGIAAFWAAEFDDAQARFEAVVEHFRPEDRRSHLIQYGLDPSGVCQMRLAFTRWFLGYPAEARSVRDDILARPVERDYWWSRVGVLHFAGLLSLETGDHEIIRHSLAAHEDTYKAHDIASIHHNVIGLSGFIDVLEGRREAGIRLIERIRDDLQTSYQMPGQQSTVMRILLAAHEVVGPSAAGLETATQLLATDDGVRIWHAEARRMRAEFLAALGAGTGEVEAEFALALQIARHQRARSLELRAATSLLRHRLERGDRSAAGEARALLAGLVATVADGSDTRDLKRAHDLLARS